MFDDVTMVHGGRCGVHGGWCGVHGAYSSMVGPNFGLQSELPEHVRDRHIVGSLYLFTTCPTLVYGSQHGSHPLRATDPKIWTGQFKTRTADWADWADWVHLLQSGVAVTIEKPCVLKM